MIKRFVFFIAVVMGSVSLHAADRPDFSELAAKVSPAVVNISTTKKMPNRPRTQSGDPLFDEFFGHFFGVPGGGRAPRAQTSLGSGFVISADGNILTNNHVIGDADEIVVKFADNAEYKAKLIGKDPKTDMAIIRVDGKNLPYVELGDSDALKIGEWVVAIGNPFGLGQTVTAGIVSAKGRVIGAGPYDDFIQTDASINPGNSGGPLFNMNGQVVGINTAIIASGQGIGFAIPISLAKTLAPQLISKGSISRGWLGVAIQDLTPELAESYGLKTTEGVLVSGVEPGGPAERGGLQRGDVILKYNNRLVKNAHALPIQVAETPVGQKVPVEVWRNGRAQTVVLTIAQMDEKGMASAAPPSSEGDIGKADAMGLYLQNIDPSEARQLGLNPQAPGVGVVAVDPGSIADQIGIGRGDILVEVNGAPISSVASFEKEIAKIKKGELIRLLLQRGNAKTFLAFRKSF